MISFRKFSQELSPEDISALNTITQKQYEIVSKLSQIKAEPKVKFERSISVLEKATDRKSKALRFSFLPTPNLESETNGLLSTEVGSRNRPITKL